MGWHQILSLLCFLFSLHSALPFASPLCPPNERNALLLFKNSFVLDSKASEFCYIYRESSYPKTNSWKKAVDCCSWDGVTCDSVTGNVINLDLSCSWLRGTFHSNISLILPKLEVLRLSLNRISGEIPTWFWGISETLKVLDLSHNLLEGGIPQFPWKQLLYVELLNNSFKGPLPIPPLSTWYFNAAHNGFTGEIPPSMCHLKSLHHLLLRNNSLSGNMPQCFDSMTNLSILDLSTNKLQGPLPILPLSLSFFGAAENDFTGEISSSICRLSSLEFLYLSHNSLSGNIPPCFGSMTNLSHLDLGTNKFQGSLPILPLSTSYFDASCNGFTGEIPASICQLISLESLYLYNNSFFGNVPICFGNITNLSVLDLTRNFLTGQLPIEIFSNTSLVVIDLYDNMFEGPIPLPSPVTFYYTIATNNLTGKIPSFICNATKLEYIDLSSNALTGSLPQCLTNFSTKLLVLKLQKNHLEGTIPQSFSLRNNLAALDLSQNWFEGILPRSLIKCKHLEVLNLSDNQIDDTFPSWLGKLPKLKVLNLRSNNFRGLLDIPKGAQLFPKLHILDLSNNNFRGPLPTKMLMNLKAMMNGENGKDESLYMEVEGLTYQYIMSVTMTMKGLQIELMKVLTVLATIDLSRNSFQGDIPGVFGHLHSLIGLNLSHNHLTGSIPPTLGNLTNLEWLDLSSNKLSGGIPRVLGDLASLGYLDMSKNQLTGRIPQDKHLSTFSSAFSENPGLCGTPLQKTCPGDAQRPPPSSSTTFNSKRHQSWFKQKTMWIGYASGIVIGISIAYISFEIGRPKWLVQGMRMLERRIAEWMEKPNRKVIKFHGH